MSVVTPGQKVLLARSTGKNNWKKKANADFRFGAHLLLCGYVCYVMCCVEAAQAVVIVVLDPFFVTQHMGALECYSK